MGLGRYLRRHIAGPIGDRVDAQNQLLCELHLRRLLESSPYNEPRRLERHGFRSFSQNDEDGILQEIFARIGVGASTFVEFGVEDGLQNNSRLLLYRGWRGLWIEADADAAHKVQSAFANELASKRLQLRSDFITRDNINELIASARLGELDLLSIDIDGNDYWIWQAVDSRPRVVVIEYNAKFRPPTTWVMEYNARHRWDRSDYHGASLQSLANLGRGKGYRLVGSGLAGVNAFFVRDDLCGDLFPAPDAAALYNPPRFYLQSIMAAGHPAAPFGPYQLV
jgi:hypothetical protein